MIQNVKALCALATLFFLVFALAGCRPKIKIVNDEVYSRHLQAHMKLHIYATPIPDDKGDMNLIVLNDGQEIEKLEPKKLLDSLLRKKLIKPTMLVGVEADDRLQTYGVAGYKDYQGQGLAAGKYEDFIENELLPFVKKRSGIRKFQSITMAGFSLGGLSAFDFAWDHWDKIDNVGVFSGSFWVRDKDAADPTYSDDKDRLIINKLKGSRKRPKLRYWFYAGAKEETADRDKDGIIDVIDDTKDIISLIESKNPSVNKDITYEEEPAGIHDYSSWKKVFPRFLVWAVGK